MISLAIEQVPSQLPITSHTLKIYLHNGDETHSLSLFKDWLQEIEPKEVEQLLNLFKSSSDADKLSEYLKNI
jgi:GrpB-like predicted nucleotidyltransferase (UPF0157 family)